MDRASRAWFIAERARALALVLLTRRDDLIIEETRDDNGLDFTVSIKTAQAAATRPFGVCLASTMQPIGLVEASKQVRPELEKVRASGPFHFPVCVFYFSVKDGQGYFAWACEPVVSTEGEPRLSSEATSGCRKLDDAALADIVAQVQRWYASLIATIHSGNREPAGAGQAS